MAKALGNENPHAEMRKWVCSACGQRPNLRDRNWRYDTNRETTFPGSGWVHQCQNTLYKPDKTWYGTTYDPE